jgi:hypothetical protein
VRFLSVLFPARRSGHLLGVIIGVDESNEFHRDGTDTFSLILTNACAERPLKFYCS